MKRFTCTLLLCLASAPVFAQSNAAPSVRVALAPCLLFADVILASTREDIDTANACNVPASATAVDLAVTVVSLASGSLKLWEYDGTEPNSPVMYYPAGTTSSFGAPRTCAPYPECLHNISAKATTAVGLTLVVVGYYIPAEIE